MSIIEDCLRDILIEDLFVELEKDRILPSYSLRQDLGIDSLGFVELREQVEKRFNIAISDDDFKPENFSTISSLTSRAPTLSRRRSSTSVRVAMIARVPATAITSCRSRIVTSSFGVTRGISS